MKCSRTTAIPCMLTAALVALASPAAAQFAAPSLLPDSFVTPNPAAMQWGGESRAGVSYTQSEVDAVAAGYDTESFGGGLRALWSWGGLALEWEQSRDTADDIAVESDRLQGALSALPLNWLSVGVLYQEAGFKLNEPAGVALDAESKLLAYGASLRLFDLLYLGYAQGRDEADIEVAANLVPGSDFKFSDERDVRGWGAALSGGKDFRYHLEYHVIEFDAFEFEPTMFFPVGGKIDEHTDRRAVLEIGWRSIVLGAALTEVDEKSSQRDVSVQRYSAAWILASGLGLVYANETSKSEDQQTGDKVEERTAHRLSVVYLF